MMASGQTEHYGLSQWEPGDQVLREEFNGDNQTIDAALGELTSQLPQFICGSYTGTGGTGIGRFITGKRPKLLIYATPDSTLNAYYAALLAAENLQISFVSTGTSAFRTHVTFTDEGFNFDFSLAPDSNGYNVKGRVYHYLAIC